MDLVIGLGEYLVSDKPEDKIKTYALASCVALTVYCPTKKTLGMVHIVLPTSSINSDISKSKPGYFADIAVPLLINETCNKSLCKKSDLVIGIFGGAKSVKRPDLFNIGEKNLNETMKQLESLGLKYTYIDTGGTNSRSLEMDVETGTPKINYQKINF